MRKGKAQSSTIKVLLVEDNVISQIATKMLLEDLKCSVEVVCDGKSTLDCELGKYDMILLDICLPDIDGIALFKKIREKEKLKNLKKGVPIIAYTAEEKIKEECLAVGFDDFITKPCNFDEFKRLIQCFAFNNNKLKSK